MSTLKEFLYKVQKKVDKENRQEIDDMTSILEGRKNVLNLKVLVCVDVSGSISREQFCAFMRQIDKIRGLSQVKVLETDTKVVACYDYFKVNKSQVMRLGGGGGTDFVECFEVAKKAKPDVLVFATDGDDCGNCKNPGIPTAWVTTKHGHAPYDWGTVCTQVDK